MTSTINKQVKRAVDQVAKEGGFKKLSGSLWTKVIDPAAPLLLVLYLQKSNWGMSFDIEIGARDAEGTEKFEIWACPLRGRIERCVADGDEIKRLLDFTDSVDVERQIQELISLLRAILGDFFAVSSRRDLLSFIHGCQELQKGKGSFLVSGPFLEELGQSPGPARPTG
jgi:uncharacterized protein DUF4304